MTDLRPCGHPRGDTRWCPQCALEEARQAPAFRSSLNVAHPVVSTGRRVPRKPPAE